MGRMRAVPRGVQTNRIRETTRWRAHGNERLLHPKFHNRRNDYRPDRSRKSKSNNNRTRRL